ncbi:MAG TPA: FKBP-type peptidyl-prolyl cis-trans isomerase [Planctomycetaceae bacterium]|nr:FKBP-type peptidyl-prolyl cis-trans isomerase [Planctomycetaceae bacterium]
MPSLRFAIFVVPVIFVLALFAGCSDESAPAKKPDAEPALKPKKADLPELPDGAGEMDADAPRELTPTKSGLYYRILRKSDGPKPTRADTVVANYKGWLDDGQQFDSSYDGHKPIELPLSRFVRGWTEGLQLIGQGGMIELEVPYELGYGFQGRPPKIPPFATLHFIVELVEVK